MIKNEYRSVAAIVCWYHPENRFPWYFQYFLKSCEFNSTIDFLVFSDIEYNGSDLPGNVKIIYKSKEEVELLISKKIGFTVASGFLSNKNYKICDFRPAFGLIFEDYLRGYNFWAQSDIDVIFGDLRNFVSNEILDNHDFISMSNRYISGCFFIYRNEDRINNFFTRSKDYEIVFKSPVYFGFDEFNHKQYEIIRNGKSWDEIETDIECFSQLLAKAQQLDKIKIHFDSFLISGKPGKIKFENGILTYKNTFEMGLYHLHYLKKIYKPSVKKMDIPSTFRISNTKIYR